eukprot:gnl/TRDRNA2_/TRDRNA2_156679_c2_seq1.p1 gnl/TRDRNA2_/TRDRNA2_156679_c2~~gnl/TRDRNA2_/TRDRNA2_156679_c2_seq1.p1  ORF type:complete len:296 (+),score=46.74 gnl/TRDRNA2_/TRDRNA2_156679_c2_seq1:53-889(+)
MASTVLQRFHKHRSGAIVALEPSAPSKAFVDKLVKEDGHGSMIRVIGKNAHEVSESDLGQGVTTIGALVGEPFFYDTVLPWQSLLFWYGAFSLRQNGLLEPNATLMPRRAMLVGMLVTFPDYIDESQAPVGTARGFHYELYDAVTAKRRDMLQPMSIWEYPYTTVTKRHVLLEFDMASEPHDVTATVDMHLLEGVMNPAGTQRSLPNALVCWLDYQLDAGGLVMARGLPEREGEPSHQRVAVKFFYDEVIPKKATAVTVQAAFIADECDVKLELTRSV